MDWTSQFIGRRLIFNPGEECRDQPEDHVTRSQMDDDYTKNLKELFETLDDYSLIERRDSGNLTEVAQKLIENEISKRGITKDTEKFLNEQVKNEQEMDEALA
jgi:hypothetical protein